MGCSLGLQLGYLALTGFEGSRNGPVQGGIGCQGLGLVPARELSPARRGELLPSLDLQPSLFPPKVAQGAERAFVCATPDRFGLGFIVSFGGGAQSPS